MVDLTVQAEDISPVSLDTRLGAFQQPQGEDAGAALAGVNQGLSSLLNIGTQIDESLFDQLINVNRPAAQQLKSQATKAALKQTQDGLTSNAVAFKQISFVQQARAAGLSPEVINETLAGAGLSFGELQRRSLAAPGGTPPKTRDQMTIEQANEFGIPFLDRLDDLDGVRIDVAEATARAREIQLARDKLDYFKANDQLDLETELKFARETSVPLDVHIAQDFVGRLLIRGDIPLHTGDPTDPKTGTVDMTKMDPDHLTALTKEINNFRQAQQDRYNGHFAGRASNEQLQQLMQGSDYYYDQGLEVLNGTAKLESLVFLDQVQEGLARDAFYGGKFPRRESIVAAGELAGILEKLGLAGLQTKEDLANFVLNPMVKDVIVGAVSAIKLAGIKPVDQAQIFTILGDFIADPRNDMEARGEALCTLLPNVMLDAVNDTNLYHAMLSMMASPDGALRVIKTMDSQSSRVVKSYIQRGFLEHRQDFTASFLGRLDRELNRAAFFSPPKEGESTPQSELPPELRISVDLIRRPLGDFVNDNLFRDDAVGLDLKALDDLAPSQKAVVEERYRQLLTEFEVEFEWMSQIQDNFFSVRQKQAMNRMIDEDEKFEIVIRNDEEEDTTKPDARTNSKK